MSIEEVIDINITEAAAASAQQGFGTHLILSPNAAFAARTQEYSSLVSVENDFGVGSPEALAAGAALQQGGVSSLKIGRTDTLPTVVREVEILSAVDETDYAITVVLDDGSFETVVYTSVVGDTLAGIALGLEGLLNAVAGVNYAAVAGATTVTLTGAAPGDWFSLEVGSVDLLSLESQSLDPTIAASLNAILAEDDEWLTFSDPYESAASQLSAATWANANERLFLANTSDTAVLGPLSGATDIGAQLFNLGQRWVAMWYHPSQAARLASGIAGRQLAQDPGSSTWALKDIQGVAPVTLQGSQGTNLKARRMNTLTRCKGSRITTSGFTFGSFLDCVRGLAFLEDQQITRVFGVLIATEKVAFDDGDILLLENEIIASLDDAVRRKIIAADPPFTVTTTAVADTTAADRAARCYNGIEWEARKANAIEKVVIRGRVTI